MMIGSTDRRLLVAALSICVAAGAVAAPAAGQTRSITDRWPLLATSSDGTCKLDITGNGKFMLLRASGFNPGAAAHLAITNAAMKPIDWNIRASSAGSWSLVYLPLLWNNGDGTVRQSTSSGTVAVTLEARDCRVAASAAWRREIRVIS